MALDRTWYDTLVDDDGSGTTGTVWDKAAVDALMDAVDAELVAYRCCAYANATQSLANATFVSLNLQAELFDVGGMHDVVTNNTRITIPAGGDGYYLLLGSVFFAANATGHRAVTMLKNGAGATQQVLSDNNGANGLTIQASAVLALVAGDYIELQGFQASGGALDTGSAGLTATNMLTVTRLV